MGDFNADPAEPGPARLRDAGFRSAYAEANGAEPAVTWPSGLQAPAMDTDGDPECLDYVWVRGAVRVESARLVFDRPDSGGPDALPERPSRARDRARDRVVPGDRRAHSASLIAATGAPRPRTRSRRSPRRWRSRPATVSSSTSAGRPTASRWSTTTRRSSGSTAGPTGSTRSPSAALDALGIPTLADVLARRRATDVPRRRAEGRSAARPSSGCWRPAAVRACGRGRVVVRAGRPGAGRAPRAGLAALAQQP